MAPYIIDVSCITLSPVGGFYENYDIIWPSYYLTSLSGSNLQLNTKFHHYQINNKQLKINTGNCKLLMITYRLIMSTKSS